MKRPIVVSFLMFFMVLAFVSCEDPLIGKCDCPTGAPIEDWEEADSTHIQQNDTIGGFDVSLDNWKNSETHDILL